MKTIDCPLLGRRPVGEFTISGVLEPERSELTDTTAARWAFERFSVPTERVEWWYHGSSQRWFMVRRNTASNEILSVEAAHE